MAAARALAGAGYVEVLTNHAGDVQERPMMHVQYPRFEAPVHELYTEGPDLPFRESRRVVEPLPDPPNLERRGERASIGMRHEPRRSPVGTGKPSGPVSNFVLTRPS